MSSPIRLFETLNGQKIHREIMADLSAMQKAAQTVGVDLSVASGYRSIERQTAIWNTKWQGLRPLYDAEGNELNFKALSETQRVFAILNWSALPGASRHHWGTDIDVYDAEAIKQSGVSLQLIDKEYLPGGPCVRLYEFLKEHAYKFGFSHVYTAGRGKIAEEKWHLSHLRTAHHYEKATTLYSIQSLIASLEIEGKTVVLDNLEHIFKDYIAPYLTH